MNNYHKKKKKKERTPRLAKGCGYSSIRPFIYYEQVEFDTSIMDTQSQSGKEYKELTNEIKRGDIVTGKGLNDANVIEGVVVTLIKEEGKITTIKINHDGTIIELLPSSAKKVLKH